MDTVDRLMAAQRDSQWDSKAMGTGKLRFRWQDGQWFFIHHCMIGPGDGDGHWVPSLGYSASLGPYTRVT